MPLPRLQDVEALLRTCDDVLGETILYQIAGAGSYSEITATVDYSDKVQSIEGVDAMDQRIACDVLKIVVPTKPSRLVRIQLPKVADRTFMPINVGTSEDGDHWTFDLKDVTADA